MLARIWDSWKTNMLRVSVKMGKIIWNLKFKVCILFDPATPVLGIHPKEAFAFKNVPSRTVCECKK